ncbi:hypothetical protein H0Z60_09170 [Ectothiorhodospiraceae bacterium WFHF3C12]|nr:hypothetical protein [Ectothiorhodospiraceae bacterium WFHF3C12]
MKARKAKPARWKYLINGLVLLAPVYFLYDMFTPPSGQEPLPEQRFGASFTATPTPADSEPPYAHEGQLFKDFSVVFCEGCLERIRTAYLIVSDDPPPLPEDGLGVIHGHGPTKHVHVPYPPEREQDERLWLTVQSWTGEIYRTSWSMSNN